MRTTLNLRDDLVEKAQKLSKIEGKTSLVHAGLEALVEKISRERLIALAGSEKKLKGI